MPCSQVAWKERFSLTHITAKDKHHTIFSHLFYHTVNFIGWSDHKVKWKCLSLPQMPKMYTNMEILKYG